MKNIFFFIVFALIPSFAFADIAGPVLTKNQACQEKDGSSMNRLQISWNGKKSDTLYYFKQDKILYYIVSMFSGKKDDSYPNYYHPSNGLFIYQYSCTNKKSSLLISQDLRKMVKTINFGGTGSEIPTPEKIKSLNAGKVTSVSDKEIILTLIQTQAPGESVITLKK